MRLALMVMGCAGILAGCQRGPARHEGASFAVAGDGKTFAFTTGPVAGNVLMLRSADGKLSQIASGGYFESPAFSPDQKTLLVATGKNFRTKLTVLKVNLLTGKFEPFAENKEQSRYAPSFSPDGSMVAFRAATRPRSDSMGGVDWRDVDLWVSDPDGANPRQLTHSKFEQMSSPRWSADGGRIVFATREKDGQTWIWEVEAASGKLIRETELKNNEGMPVYLDGRLVVVSDRETFGKYRIGYLDPDGGVFEAIVKDEGYFLEPQVASGKLFALEDVTKQMRFRISQIDPATGSIVEVVPESAFDPKP